MDLQLEGALARGARKHRAAVRAHLAAFLLWLVALAGCLALCFLAVVCLTSWLLSTLPPQSLFDYARCFGRAMGYLLALGVTNLVWQHVSSRLYSGLVARWRCIRNMRRHSPHQAYAELRRLCDDPRGFALYLRSFASERQDYETDYIDPPPYPDPVRGMGYARIGRWTLEISDHRTDDNAIVTALTAHLPPIALANVADPLPPPALMMLFVTDADWFDVFAALALRATVIALFENRRTDGLLREQAYLEEKGLTGRTARLRPGDHMERVIEDVWLRTRVHKHAVELSTRES